MWSSGETRDPIHVPTRRLHTNHTNLLTPVKQARASGILVFVTKAVGVWPQRRPAPTLGKPTSGTMAEGHMTLTDTGAADAVLAATGRPQGLREALAERVVIADGAMGTMLQASNA